MKILLNLTLAAIAAMVLSPEAKAQSRAQYESMVAAHASANNVPEALVHRVIVRESKYHPNLVGRGGTIGLMQIKLRPRAASATPATPRACATPTPISPGEPNISPAPIAPPTAITAAPCVIMRAAITMPPSASAGAAPADRTDARERGAAQDRRHPGRRESNADREVEFPFPGRGAARERCSAEPGSMLPHPPGPGSAAHHCALRCVRGTNAVQFPR